MPGEAGERAMGLDEVSPVAGSATEFSGVRNGAGRVATDRTAAAPSAAQIAQAPPLIAAAEDAAPLSTAALDGLLTLIAQTTASDAAGAQQAQSSAITAYARTAIVDPLLASTPPERAIVRETLTALWDAASKRGASLTQLLRDGVIVAENALPSRNSASPHLLARSAIYGANGEPFEIYVARRDPASYEIVVYRSADGAPGTGFPYNAPPVYAERFVIDPASGAILSSFVSQLLRRDFDTPWRTSLALFGAMITVVVLALFFIALAMHFNAPLAAALALLAGGVLMFKLSSAYLR
jgi:hypothetical protein